MSREELEKMKADELATICKERNIPHYKGKSRFRKNEMIEAILKQQEQTVDKTLVEDKIEQKDVGAAAKEKGAANIKQLPGTQQYLENIKVGTLVAFKESNVRMNTAAVQNVSFKRRQLKLVTQYGKEYIVSFDDVVWVRTTKRWPKFIMDVLKGQQRKEQPNGSTGQKR